MILDKQHMMSEAQAFTAQAEAISTNVIDLGVDALGLRGAGGSIMELFATVQTAFTSSGAATLVLLVEDDMDVAFGSARALFTSATLALATVAVAGYSLVNMRLPIDVQRYIRCTYTVATADMTAGAVDAGLKLSGDTNVAGAART